ncbi:hypothetical protein HQN60_04315 [Deefgea piscis]|uniref:Uncharacterized protein n=1 Tax=Deefgea piscis TaxID=2739061 RepID=A0A6M8SRR6_9NEIS|nr:hypothetical protein [Deefgea piscis]QKJ65996.1 hypothetical protein HQN60_04315 [Deefgea piscis]
MIKGIKYTFFISIVVFSTFWFATEWSLIDWPWEAFIALIAALAALARIIYQDDKAFSKLQKKFTLLCEHDLNLISDIFTVFPVEETTRFFKEHDFANSFRDSKTKGLFYFVDYWDVVDKKFIDVELEKQRSEFFIYAKDVARNIAQYTSPKSADLQSVDPYGRNTDFHLDPLIEQDIKMLNATSSAFFEKYEAFIKYCLHRKSVCK